jgi:hypothetical protein
MTDEFNGVGYPINRHEPFAFLLIYSILVMAELRRKLIHAGFCGVGEISTGTESDARHAVTDALHAYHFCIVIKNTNTVRRAVYGRCYSTANRSLRHDIPL